MNWKKWVPALLAVLLIFGMAACSEQAEAPETEEEAQTSAETPEFLTIGDAVEADSSDYPLYSYDEHHFIYVTLCEGEDIRVAAEMNGELCAAMDAVDFFADDRDEQIFKIAGDLEVIQTINLTAGIPSQEELDGLVGKTGADLENEGYNYSGSMIDEDQAEYYLYKDFYEIAVVFDGTIDPNDIETFNEMDCVKDMKVTSVRYSGLSDYVTDFEPPQ